MVRCGWVGDVLQMRYNSNRWTGRNSGHVKHVRTRAEGGGQKTLLCYAAQLKALILQLCISSQPRFQSRAE